MEYWSFPPSYEDSYFTDAGDRYWFRQRETMHPADSERALLEVGLREALDPLEFVRTIAVARITMPRSVVRLSAGREDMSEETQALCFLAGANSIFYGPKLLTTPNPGRDRDMALLDKLGLRPMER